MSVFYLKRLSGEVIQVEIGESVELLYPIARTTLGENTGYEIKLFNEGELLPQDADAIAGRVIDVLYVPLEYKVYLEYLDNTLDWPDYELTEVYDRYRIHVTLGEVIIHRFFFFERDGLVFTPDTHERFTVWLDSFAELVEYMLSSTEYTEYTEEVRSRLVEAIVGEWVPKCVAFEEEAR